MARGGMTGSRQNHDPPLSVDRTSWGTTLSPSRKVIRLETEKYVHQGGVRQSQGLVIGYVAHMP